MKNRDWPRAGSLVIGLLIAAVGGLGLLAVLEPGAIAALVTTEL